MNTPTDLLINRLNPDLEFCPCCEDWKFLKFFDNVPVLSTHINEWHKLCNDCTFKINFIKINERYISENELEDMRRMYFTKYYSYNNSHLLEKEYLISISLRYYKTLVLDFYHRIKYEVIRRKRLEECEISKALWSPAKSIIFKDRMTGW